MGEYLVDCPHEAVAEDPCGSQASRKQGELHPREQRAESRRTSFVSVKALGPVEVKEPHTRAGSPQPADRQGRIVDDLEPILREMSVEQT